MAGKELGRLITAMVTPFASDGAVNYDQLGKLAGQLISRAARTRCSSPAPPANHRRFPTRKSWSATARSWQRQTDARP